MPNITANHAITYTNPVTCGMVSPADVMSFSQKVYIAAVEPHFQPRLQTFLMFGSCNEFGRLDCFIGKRTLQRKLNSCVTINTLL